VGEDENDENMVLMKHDRMSRAYDAETCSVKVHDRYMPYLDSELPFSPLSF